MTEWISATLAERGGAIVMPSRSASDHGYRFEIDGETVEVLGSEGLKANPKTVDRLTTIQVPGGTQALRRTERVPVSLDGAPAVHVRRPSLLGAILIKARAVARRRRDKFESDRQDLILLLWLRSVEKKLDFEDPALVQLFSPEVITRAAQASRLLVLDQS